MIGNWAFSISAFVNERFSPSIPFSSNNKVQSNILFWTMLITWCNWLFGTTNEYIVSKGDVLLKVSVNVLLIEKETLSLAVM